VSTQFQGPPRDSGAAALPAPGGLSPSAADDDPGPPHADPLAPSNVSVRAATLAQLPVGARLVIRCRKDWRVASVASVEPDCVRLSVASPTGHTYRLRRPHDAPLTYEGALPLLGEVTAAGWRALLIRYDARW
jgi:hypothetical protein